MDVLQIARFLDLQSLWILSPATGMFYKVAGSRPTPQGPCSYARHVPGFHTELVYEDLLHNTLQGHGGDACCSCVKDLLVRRSLPGHDWEDSLRLLALDFRRWCKQHQVTHVSGLFTLGTLGLTTLSAYPVLHSRVKAAHCRLLISFIAQKAVELDSGDEHSRYRTACLWSLARFFSILESSGRWLTQGQRDAVLRAAVVYLHSYQWLAASALERRECLWMVRPKLHYFCHLVARMSSSFLNPRKCQTLIDETFVGVIARIARQTSSQTTSLRALQRWTLYIAVQWHACAQKFM